MLRSDILPSYSEICQATRWLPSACMSSNQQLDSMNWKWFEEVAHLQKHAAFWSLHIKPVARLIVMATDSEVGIWDTRLTDQKAALSETRQMTRQLDNPFLHWLVQGGPKELAYYESWVVPAGVPSALADIGGRVEANYWLSQRKGGGVVW